jgi:uncharacterized cupin superfamily protein
MAADVWADVPARGCESAARVLIVSSNGNPDVAEYPDSGKVAYIVDGQHHFHRVGDAVEHGGPE